MAVDNRQAKISFLFDVCHPSANYIEYFFYAVWYAQEFGKDIGLLQNALDRTLTRVTVRFKENVGVPTN